MNPVTHFLLNDCFWSFFDNGIAPEQTPLFTEIFEGNSLADTLCRRFGISREQAEFETAAARKEVQL